MGLIKRFWFFPLFLTNFVPCFWLVLGPFCLASTNRLLAQSKKLKFPYFSQTKPNVEY